MRIIGGKFRGRVLAQFDGEEVRPTADRVKESLFNILAPRISGSRVLDLFSGSGALGLESLSRGAKEVVFNDVSKDSVGILKKNVARLKPPVSADEVKIYNLDYLACLERVTGAFDLVFIDPPYRFDYGALALKRIAERGLLADGGVIVYERDRTFEGNVKGLEKFDERKYGKTTLTFFRKEEQ